MSMSVCVVGGAGRMGTRVRESLDTNPAMHLGAALISPEDELTVDGVTITTDPRRAFLACDVVVDFSAPPACAATLPVASDLGRPYVLASTGLGAEHEAVIGVAAQSIPVLVAANTSLGVNALLALVERAARLLENFEVEVQEIHHHDKRDAPSGTALALGDAVRTARSGLRDVMGRAGKGPPRAADELGFAALRGGDVAGEHTVFFFGAGERVELTHRATTPTIFADGAIAAAAWLVGKPSGRYSMRDVLGI